MEIVFFVHVIGAGIAIGSKMAIEMFWNKGADFSAFIVSVVAFSFVFLATFCKSRCITGSQKIGKAKSAIGGVISASLITIIMVLVSLALVAVFGGMVSGSAIESSCRDLRHNLAISTCVSISCFWVSNTFSKSGKDGVFLGVFTLGVFFGLTIVFCTFSRP